MAYPRRSRRRVVWHILDEVAAYSVPIHKPSSNRVRRIAIEYKICHTVRPYAWLLQCSKKPAVLHSKYPEPFRTQWFLADVDYLRLPYFRRMLLCLSQTLWDSTKDKTPLEKMLKKIGNSQLWDHKTQITQAIFVRTSGRSANTEIEVWFLWVGKRDILGRSACMDILYR